MELIATSKDYEELVKIRDAIETLNRKLEGKDREISSPKIRRLIDNELGSIDLVDEATGFVHEIHIIGIYWMEASIAVNCATCHKLLFSGPKSEARHLIIYSIIQRELKQGRKVMVYFENSLSTDISPRIVKVQFVEYVGRRKRRVTHIEVREADLEAMVAGGDKPGYAQFTLF